MGTLTPLETFMIIFSGSFLIGAVIYAYFLNKRQQTEKKERAVPNRANREGGPRRVQGRNRGARLRFNNANQQNEAEEHSDNEQENAQNEDGENPDLADSKLGAKKRAKLEAKAEKKALREAEEASRKEKKKKDAQAEEERKKEEEKQLAEEKRIEEEEKKAREEKERKEYEEYLKMKEAFSVEEEGYEDGDERDEQNLLQDFVNYIKTQKVVVIEDLAAKFKLKTQAAIDRIKDLQNDEILSGVIDDRGKFIYVSQKEMEDVAKFIKQRGRVSISELAENSNQLINLNASGVVA